jgi:hypothetical protein
LVTNSSSPVLTDSQTLDAVVNCLSEHIPIYTQEKCDQQNIFEILIRAATQRDSIENTARVLTKAPTSNNIRYHLEKYDNLDTLETALNKALQNQLPRHLNTSSLVLMSGWFVNTKKVNDDKRGLKFLVMWLISLIYLYLLSMMITACVLV